MTLSIIIPTLNEEKVLERTLKSLKALKIVDYEIIISDGDSKDHTLDIANRYADKVVTHHGQHRQTIAEGRNAGAAVAQGTFFLFIDADVLIPNINGFFKEALELFKEEQGLVGLTVFLKVLPEHITLSDRLFFGFVNRLYQFQNNVLHIGAASGEFQMVRANVFRKIGGFDNKIVLGEDNDLFSRLSKVGFTRVATGLHVMHTSRRAHQVGWAKLLFLWTFNSLYRGVRKKSYHKEWKPIR